MIEYVRTVFLPLGADTSGALPYDYQLPLVALSYFIAAFASYAAFHLVGRLMSAANGVIRTLWLGAGALSMGAGIWSMHFIAILAIDMPMTVHYDEPLTALSIVFAILGSGYAFQIVTNKPRDASRLLYGGVVMGAAIGAMHYTGMAAMRMSAIIRYDPVLFALSVAVAVGLSAVALLLLSDWRSGSPGRRRLPRLVSAAVMGLSVTAMQYTGMAATVFMPSWAMPPPDPSEFEPAILVAVIGAASILITGMALVAAFVEERLQTSSRQIRRSESLLESVVRTAPDAIAVVDDGCAIRSLNPAGARLFDYAAEDVIGRDISLLFPDLKTQVFACQSTGDGQNPFPNVDVLETDGRRMNGDRVAMEVNFGAIAVNDGSMITLIARDITERRRREQEQRRLEQQLSQSRKMESLGTLAGGVAHDINNALVPILGLTTVTRMQLPDGGKGHDYLDRIAAAAERIRDLTQKILAFSRADGGDDAETTVVDLAATVNEAVAFLRPTLPASLAIELDVDDRAGQVLVGNTQVHQILMNLLTNAAHAMDGRPGQVRIALAPIELSAGEAAALALPAGGYAHLQVADDGPGMMPDVLARIFDPFFTTKGVGEGTGLGLSVIHGIVVSLGGTIVAASEPGAGTRFDIYLATTAAEHGIGDADATAVAAGYMGPIAAMSGA